jgi:hypothetical protein
VMEILPKIPFQHLLPLCSNSNSRIHTHTEKESRLPGATASLFILIRFF